MILNKIRTIRQKFRDHKTLVIACDGKHNWRKNFFPFYKANRKKDREQSDFDWQSIYVVLNTIRDELADNFPYAVIHIDGAEADDIIATIVSEHGVQLNSEDTEDIIVVSGDKDFVQLQQYANVKQYDPIKNKMVINNDPSRFLKELIIKGDRGDGIPNILSGDDCLVTGVRQKKVTEKLISSIISEGIQSKPEDVVRGFKRNEQLIDLTFIPEHLKVEILNQYKSQISKCALKRTKMFNYFIVKKLKNLVECVGEF